MKITVELTGDFRLTPLVYKLTQYKWGYEIYWLVFDVCIWMEDK